MHLVRAPQRLAVAGQQAAGAVGEEQPLVRVEGDGVRALDAGERNAAARGQLEEAAVRRVDVQPELLLRRDRRDVVERIDRTCADGACTRDDEERSFATRPVANDLRAQRIDVHAQVRVGRHDPHRGRR